MYAIIEHIKNFGQINSRDQIVGAYRVLNVPVDVQRAHLHLIDLHLVIEQQPRNKIRQIEYGIRKGHDYEHDIVLLLLIERELGLVLELGGHVQVDRRGGVAAALLQPVLKHYFICVELKRAVEHVRIAQLIVGHEQIRLVGAERGPQRPPLPTRHKQQENAYRIAYEYDHDRYEHDEQNISVGDGKINAYVVAAHVTL